TALGDYAYVPNVDTMTTGWADVDYSASKGAFAEAFGQATGGDWNLSMNRALRFTSTNPAYSNADRMFIMQPYVRNGASAEAMRQRAWAMGTYLLLKGDHTYINMFAQSGSPWGAMWYPEYDLNLGAPTDIASMPTNVSGYRDPSSGLYIRDFQNGK